MLVDDEEEQAHHVADVGQRPHVLAFAKVEGLLYLADDRDI